MGLITEIMELVGTYERVLEKAREEVMIEECLAGIPSVAYRGIPALQTLEGI